MSFFSNWFWDVSGSNLKKKGNSFCYCCPEWSLPGAATSQAQELWVMESWTALSGTLTPNSTFRAPCSHFLFHSVEIRFVSPSMFLLNLIRLFICWSVFCCCCCCFVCSFLRLYSLLMCRFYYYCYEDLFSVFALWKTLPASCMVSCDCLFLYIINFCFPVTCWLCVVVVFALYSFLLNMEVLGVDVGPRTRPFPGHPLVWKTPVIREMHLYHTLFSSSLFLFLFVCCEEKQKSDGGQEPEH